MSISSTECCNCGVSFALQTDQTYQSENSRFFAYKPNPSVHTGQPTLVDSPKIWVSHMRCPNCEFIFVDATVSATDNRGEEPIKIEEKIPLFPHRNEKYKTFPTYVNDQLKSPILDYQEACLISELSPRASLTLSRRCLQGLIEYQFPEEINNKNLYSQINSIEDKISPSTFSALHAVRTLGNSGAHPNANELINSFVTTDDAHQATSVIEYLIHQWIIVPHEDAEMLQQITNRSAEYTDLKQSGTNDTQ